MRGERMSFVNAIFYSSDISFQDRGYYEVLGEILPSDFLTTVVKACDDKFPGSDEVSVMSADSLIDVMKSYVFSLKKYGIDTKEKFNKYAEALADFQGIYVDTKVRNLLVCQGIFSVEGLYHLPEFMIKELLGEKDAALVLKRKNEDMARMSLVMSKKMA